MHEVRFDGAFIGRFDSAFKADVYVNLHQKNDAEHAKRFTVQPARSVELFCRGNLVDTFETNEAASAAIEERANDEFAPKSVWKIEVRQD